MSAAQAAAAYNGLHEQQLVTMRLENQLLGIPVQDVREILQGQNITRIPLVSPEIAGALNLRGRIVTVLDICHRMQLPYGREKQRPIFVVVEHKGELYSLMVDSVGDVLNIPQAEIQAAPANLNGSWRELSNGVYKLEKELLVILDPHRVFDFSHLA